MTKGGSGKPKTLGRLIFGEKRKQHASPSRHRSSTRNGGSTADLSSSNAAAANAGAVNKNSINLHDWAVWRMQLNEQMSATMGEGRADFKQMRQFLQSTSFYQQHSRDPSSGKYNGVQLLFSIPHAKIKPELLDGLRGGITKNNNTETTEPTTYEQKKVRSNSDDRTTTSVNSISAIQPMVIDKTISQLFPKGLIGNTGGFLQTNEQMVAADGIRPRRTTRSSFTASDRIHATLQKAVKDGNVLEKIKAFEMQAAAAQAESALKLSNTNHRMQSTAHRTLSPAIIHPIQNTISPISVQQQQLPIRSTRGRNVHPVQQRRDSTHGPMTVHESRKGAHVLEPAHGDVILKRRTSSQKVVHEEDYSITAITSMALTASQGHHRNHHHQQQHHLHRTSTSRSRHRQEMTYDKRSSSKTEINSHKHQQKQKVTTTPSAKSTSRRRWLKGRKETPTETPTQDDKQEISITKSNKSNKKKKKNTEQISSPTNKEKPSSDNNRVYGVPNPNVNEQNESDTEKNHNDNTNTYMSPREEDISQSKECDTVIPTTTMQRRSSKKHHQQKLSSTDGEILSKVDEDTRFSRPTDDHAHRSDINDDDDDDDDQSEGDVFIEDTSIKPTLKIVRHQSNLNLPTNESRRFQQQSANPIRRHASQCSADECTSERRFQHSKENPLKKKQLPITLITRKNKINQDEQVVYDAPHSEQTQPPVCNSHTLKKQRQFHTINTIGSSTTNAQNNNKQVSKQILHAIMNSINTNQEQSTPVPAQAATINDEFFENGPHTNPEETISNISPTI